jgi:glycosyltransferase involved in cell wall biosynthesis/MoaA/NifB/PqqE/SkfB family radical SAM enzyme
MKHHLKCHRPWTGFEITDHLGDVRPCCWGKHSCGNINERSPQEIWVGKGFQYYRDKMSKGETEEICNPSCPILQGQYVENCHTHDLQQNDGSVHASPQYLRVVPTTSCNLRCPMCYQANSPPVRLPAGLFELLEPWIARAVEIQVLGGETFLTRQCLEWIRRITPANYPNCKLAAITNGLGFDSDVCSLISERQWSWILVSIDAASDAIYRRVRGGDFRVLLRNLDRLAEARAHCASPFEVRFGFTLQMSNLGDALEFLDLCADYGAMPQYTLVFGDWHSEGPSTIEQMDAVYATLERLDKRLWQRGFGDQLLSSALAALKERRKNISMARIADVETRVEVGAEATRLQSSRGSVYRLRLSEAADISQVLSLRDELVSSKRRGECGHLALTIDSDDSPSQDDLRAAFTSLPVTTYSIEIPFFGKNDPISALWVWRTVEDSIEVAKRLGWTSTLARLDLSELGLRQENCSLEFETILELGTPQPCALSVVTPIYNSVQYLPRFLSSLYNQETGSPIEVILVDDGSTDLSIERACEALAFNSRQWHTLLLRRRRGAPYRSGTFTFSAGLAREVGVRQTLGDRVLFLDPDQKVEPNCVEEHLQWGARTGGVVVGDRRMATPDVVTSWSRLRSDALSAQPHWWLSVFTGNSSVARNTLQRVGGFDPTFQYWGLDDTDLAYRLFRAGVSVWHTPRAAVYDLAPSRSGGGKTHSERMDSFRLHMEVLYRKYLDLGILNAFRFAWPEHLREGSDG